jgi:hypothetical protein
MKKKIEDQAKEIEIQKVEIKKTITREARSNY